MIRGRRLAGTFSAKSSLRETKGNSKEENQSLRSQNVTLKRGQHSKYLPFKELIFRAATTI